ncbi:streptococcal hemagglutinin-like [Littorina saxatilis]|uniref:PDZ domain-containing protein n=1 Tax=Littorina saxatilis TaxID=31220 RepID=A0AAN9BEN4_9CAEN
MMAGLRSIPTGLHSSNHRHYDYSYHGWLRVFVVVMCIGVCSAQECPGLSSGVVAVISVFCTLAVVAIVLGIAFFLLRRRNAGFLFPPKRTRKSNGLSDDDAAAGHPRDSCYDNPAFAGHDALTAEEGRAKNSPKKNASPTKKSPKKGENQKTWVSLPGQEDFPDGLHRQGSCGSLDNNYMGPETTSVWLQSQDIIGLGFNISGNMRDGIFVSQVHNRGPAVESGKIKVGDRIVSVTIAYENIVYEDALTILSYASPYPVKVTVQKERAVSAEGRTGSSEQLNHPLYRSQSLDALQRIGKDPPFRAKRTQSEMKSETRKDSPRKSGAGGSGGGGSGSSKAASSGGGSGNRKSKGFSMSFPSDIGDVTSALGKVDVSSDVMVHAAEAVDGKLNLNGVKPAQEVLKAVKGSSVESAAPQKAAKSGSESDSPSGRKKSKIDTDAAKEFASLMDQVLDGKDGEDGEEMVKMRTSSNLNASPKTPPNKPERKKKPSNSSIVSTEDASEFFGGMGVFGVEETIQAAKSVTAHAAPRGPRDEDLGPEVEEEMIQPAFVKREVVIASEIIEFSPLEKRGAEAPRSPSPTAFANVTMSNPSRRSASPDGDPVEEEVIQATVVSKDALSASVPSSRSRKEDRGREKETKKKKEKEKEKKPAISEEELDKLIAMNAFPPGSQGWSGIQKGGSDGGIHDEFMPRDVQQQQRQQQQQHQRSSSSSSEASSSQSLTRGQRGGVAFEVRDDVLTGRPVSVDISRSRNSSASASPNRSGSHDRMGRATSPRDELLVQQQQKQQQHQQQGRAEDKENREDGLDWSGKRLVRSGSFPEIPMDDSISDWTDKNRLNDDDDDVSTTSGKRSTADTNPESDSEVEPPRVLPGRDIFKARENLANISDLSNSISSSRSSSPAVTSNGPADLLGVGGVVGSGSVGVSLGGKNAGTIGLTPTSDSNANSKTMGGVTLNASTEEDMDC